MEKADWKCTELWPVAHNDAGLCPSLSQVPAAALLAAWPGSILCRGLQQLRGVVSYEGDELDLDPEWHLNRVRVAGMECLHGGSTSAGCRTLHEALAPKPALRPLQNGSFNSQLLQDHSLLGQGLWCREGKCVLVSTIKERKTWKGKRLWTESKWRLKMLKVRHLWVMREEGSRKPEGHETLVLLQQLPFWQPNLSSLVKEWFISVMPTSSLFIDFSNHCTKIVLEKISPNFILCFQLT